MLLGILELTIAGYGHNGHMDWGEGWWIVMAVGMVLFWGLLIFVLIRTLAPDRNRREESKPDNPLAILDRRLAEGLISPDEYRERRGMLDGRRADGGGDD
jgi:putative membrane protein